MNFVYAFSSFHDEDKHNTGADLGILRGGVLGRNSSRGIRVRSAGITYTDKQKNKPGGGGLNPLSPPPWIPQLVLIITVLVCVYLLAMAAAKVLWVEDQQKAIATVPIKIQYLYFGSN